MEIIDVGEVPVEKVIDFILAPNNLLKLIGGNSVPSFVLANQIAAPNFYKALIDNSDAIDATTRNFIDFIVFYGNNSAIVEDKNDGHYRIGESYKIDGLSISKKDSSILLDEGIRFSDCLSQLVKYETENVNLRHLSNHMTRGAVTLMKRYSINETRIPSLLFINPNNVNDFFLVDINNQNSISYLYDQILKPLSICFHEIEEYHTNKSELTFLERDIKKSEKIIEESPEKIKKFQTEMSEFKERLNSNHEGEHAKIEMLQSKIQKHLFLKNLVESDSLNVSPNEYDLSILKKLKEIDNLKKEKDAFDSDKIIFNSSGEEDLLRRKNAKKLLIAKNNIKNFINQKNKESEQAIDGIRYVIDQSKYKLEQLEDEIKRAKNELNNVDKIELESNKLSMHALRTNIAKQVGKLATAGLSEFITDYSQNTFQIISHILSSTHIANEMEKTIQRDLFICHSSEDKNPYVNELYKYLELNGIKCWFDKNEIRWGDSIVKKVNEGLRISKYVLVVLSINSIKKNWPKAELEASLNIEFSTSETKVLPLLLGNEVDVKQILDYYPILSSKLFVKYSNGLDQIINLIKDRLS
jgi:hypothetical protein